MLPLSIFLWFAITVSIVNGQNSYKTIKTQTTLIRGQLEKTIWLETPFYSFKGIPYAQAPIGKLRFKAPQSVASWPKQIDAFEYGNKCAQRLNKGGFQFSAVTEDCLNLNVFVPANANETKRLPVLLVLPGGLFAGGSGDDALYGPDFVIENEIILVTLNYRVGIFGFMSLGLPEQSGNMGMKDQQMAMKWIHENIGAFGGDNNKITIIGFISGGKALGLHLLNENSSKYFNQQITISATANNINTLDGDHRCLIEYFYEKHNNSSRPSDEQLIEFLENADVNDILDFNQEAVGGPDGVITAWNPVIEKSTAKQPFLLEDPLTKLMKTKEVNKSSYFTSAQYEQLRFTDRTNGYSNPEVIDAFLKDFYTNLPIFGYNETLLKKPDYLDNVWRKIRKFYFDNATNDHDRFIQRLHLDSDVKYVYFVEKWMEQLVSVSTKDTFYSRFSLSTKLNPHKLLQAGAHADEYCYLFRCRQFNEYYQQINANKDSDENASIAFKALKNMQTLFYNFVKYGNPIHNGEPIEQFKPIERSSKADQFNFMDVKNDGLAAGIGPNANRAEFLGNIVEEVKHLVAEHGETPEDTQLQQICEAVKLGKW
ncbi:esterase B1-like [Contarinia nasturtii]|uniref:esterase B1-like n=1 Tax=Contarinia nasturtii TaxID=265458 RepID=UPI0012D3908C|nr:esterase B1-like [Contarinia nasturtii]